jgi:hypothetical protein
MHPLCCAACRHSITELYASVDGVSKPWRR